MTRVWRHLSRTEVNTFQTVRRTVYVLHCTSYTVRRTLYNSALGVCYKLAPDNCAITTSYVRALGSLVYYITMRIKSSRTKSILYTVQCTVYKNVQECTLYNVHSTMFGLHYCTNGHLQLYNIYLYMFVHFILYKHIQCILQNLKVYLLYYYYKYMYIYYKYMYI